MVESLLGWQATWRPQKIVSFPGTWAQSQVTGGEEGRADKQEKQEVEAMVWELGRMEQAESSLFSEVDQRLLCRLGGHTFIFSNFKNNTCVKGRGTPSRPRNWALV